MRKTLVLALVLVSLTGFTAAQEIEVTPSNFHEQVYSGDDIQHQLEVTWHGDSNTVVDISPVVSYENGTEVSEGIETELSSSQFILGSGDTKEVNTTISFDPALKPGVYFIEFGANTEVEIEPETETKTVTETVYVNNSDLEGQLQDTIDQLEEELNSTESDLQEARTQLEDLKSLKESLEEQGEDTQNITRKINDLQEEVETLENDKEELSNESQRFQSLLQDAQDENDKLRNMIKGGVVGAGIIFVLALIGLGYRRRNTVVNFLDENGLPQPEDEEE